MMSSYDEVISVISEYAVLKGEIGSEEAYTTARLALMDSIGCGLLAMGVPAFRTFMGYDDDATSSTAYGDIPIPSIAVCKPESEAAFHITSAIRWLDFNDTWLAKEWGHPSDNFGAILAAAYAVSKSDATDRTYSVRDVLDLAIRAYEIQGILALDNAFNRVGIDHVLLVKVASSAIAASVYSHGDAEVISSAVSHAWLDATLRTYRHAPNTGARKSWAAGDAAARGVTMAQYAMRGMPGCHSALTAPQFGFQDVWFKGEDITLQRDLHSYVMENVLFKVKYPAEFHGQTAVEAGVALHPQVVGRLDDVKSVNIWTQEPAIRIIDKRGQLNNPADRDHCIQYMTAIALMNGTVTSEDYEDAAARDTRIDALRDRMIVRERPEYTREYLDPDRRSIANAVQVEFVDGSCTEEIEVRYPIGHRRRRNEAVPLLFAKFRENVASTYCDGTYAARVCSLFDDLERLDDMALTDFMEELSVSAQEQ